MKLISLRADSDDVYMVDIIFQRIRSRWREGARARVIAEGYTEVHTQASPPARSLWEFLNEDSQN